MTSTSEDRCLYCDPDGYQCNEPQTDSGLCYWHDPMIIKNNKDDVKNLEAHAKNGGMLRGISLKNADLSGIDLVNHHHKNGYDLSHADLYRANLSGAHLFSINFEHASLMKANLTNTNLHCANLKNCNLLGCIWNNTKIKKLNIGDKLVQEVQAKKAVKDFDLVLAHDLYEQSEEIYRDLRKHSEREGIFTLSGRFIQKELTMRRYQMPKPSIARLMSKIVDLFCGYGEEPLRVVKFSILLIFICALLYFFTGIRIDGEPFYFQSGDSLLVNLEHFLTCLYYSVVTFTTLGYGEITPIGISRAIAATEAFTGSFTIALFVVVFVKKMTR
ncbi:pentapeptide repeat-containing protein [Thalassotalea crassostreae]|uniref:pentapeptide repeat-containing protein n=1 Tax=Thalassotalea crassostreae TaxID=1763536 RepID=UPI000838A4D4|nr:pentapeptide repeat-containing protein [Thalassotalea crassostreae]